MRGSRLFVAIIFGLSYSLAAIAAAPNDPEYHRQELLQQLQIEQIWTQSQGENVVVAVIDTGVDYNHADLKNNIWHNPGEIPNNGKDDDNNGFIDDYVGWDFVSRSNPNCMWGEDCNTRDKDPMDAKGHGTRVAGLIAAQQNNSWGISGIAPKVKIMALRASYGTKTGSELKLHDIAAAIKYAIDNGADIINMSYAGPHHNRIQKLLEQAHQKGIILVAAAGNHGSDQMTYPAAYPEVISVGSLDTKLERASFSNYGSWVDIYAPGYDMLTLGPNNKLAIDKGTSMSAPLVTALIAMTKSRIQGISSKELVLSSISGLQAKKYLQLARPSIAKTP